jgi:hypothetical protein
MRAMVWLAQGIETHHKRLPPRWGAGPMALMLWLDLVI